MENALKEFNMLENGDGGERIVPIIAACGPDGRSKVALSAVCLRVRACARPRARLLPRQLPGTTERLCISKAMNIAC